MTVRLVIHDQYGRALKRYNTATRKKAMDALITFQSNPRHPGLNFEKLRGYEDLYTIRVSRGMRILLRRQQDALGDYYVAFRIGPHDIYDRL